MEIQQSPISRAMVTAARAAAGDLASIDAALAACDYEHAAALVYARAAQGLDVPARTVANIVVGLTHPDIAIDLIALAGEGRAGELLDAVDRFPVLASHFTTQVATLYAAWRAGAPTAQVIKHARRLAIGRVDVTSGALLVTLARELGDPHLQEDCALLAKDIPEARAITKNVDANLADSITKMLARLPAEVAAPRAVGFTVRAAPRAGRNEPCPCGSGQKYKRCCADKESSTSRSPIAGMSWDDYLTAGAPQMTNDDVRALPLRDLARVALDKLADNALVAAFRQFLMFRRFDHAARTVDLIAGRASITAPDEWRDELVQTALGAGALDDAAAQVARMTESEVTREVRLELALRRGTGDSLAQITTAAEELLRQDSPLAEVDFAHLLLRSAPALGVLVARGALQVGKAIDNEMLVETIEEARIELGLPTGDVAWDLRAALERRDDDDEEDEEDEEDDNESRTIRAALLQSSSRITELEAALAEQREALATARANAPTPIRANMPEPERMRDLANKIERLEGLVREGVAERTELRRQLASTSTSARSSEDARPERDDDDEGIAVEDAPRGVLIPQLDRRVIDAIPVVPRPVAADALRTIGALAAGDPIAWRRMKQAKDMKKQVLMVRIGIHHRLLLRAEGDQLLVLDLVPREALDTTLKRLRS